MRAQSIYFLLYVPPYCISPTKQMGNFKSVFLTVRIHILYFLTDGSLNLLQALM
uniref:Uncharacterized protein n=1 Tax=Anguilla anguilla TaxID=7936 RepID=A0A0E9RXT8_ANGAN